MAGDALVIRQLLAGRDFAKGDPVATQTRNFVYLIASQRSRGCVLIDPAWKVADLAAPLVLSLAGQAVFEARRLGLFTAEAGSFSRPFGVDLAHPKLAAPNDSTLAPIAVEAPTAEGPQLEAWRVLIALALVLAVVDRWAFSRRVTQ